MHSLNKKQHISKHIEEEMNKYSSGDLQEKRWETEEQTEKVKLNSGYLLQLTLASANQLLDMSFVSEYQSAV